MEIRPVGAELFNADRQTDGLTDMAKAIFFFRNSANAHKNQKEITPNGELLVLQCSRSWTQSIATSTNKPQL